MQRPEKDLEEVYEAIPPPCGSHESTCRVVRRIDFPRYANPQCNASLRRLSEGKLFQFEARQIFILPEASYLKWSSSCALLVVPEMSHVHDVRVKSWSRGDQASSEMNCGATAISRDISLLCFDHWLGASAGTALLVDRPLFADRAGYAEAGPAASK
jgi:hypothetical protein